MVAVSIDASVGFRWRTQKLKNNASDQAKVIALLAAVPQSQGGKKEVWTAMPAAGPDGSCPNLLVDAICDFQKFWKGKGKFHAVDGAVDPGKHTLQKLNDLASSAPVVPPAATFICGPDVTEQVAAAWTQVQKDFKTWTWMQKVRSCNTVLIPIKRPDSPDNSGFPGNLEELKQKLQRYSDIDGWDMLPLFQGASQWLRTPPIFDPTSNGPCATPSSSDYGNSDPFASGHEDTATCSNTVQVAGDCWLNGSVNYGTFGIMVRLCSDFAANDWVLQNNSTVRTIYSLAWARMLIKAYKRFGQNPEGAIVPVAWTEATFNGGPRGVPTISGNRPKCKCSCGCKGDVVSWDYVWKPMKPRDSAKAPGDR